ARMRGIGEEAFRGEERYREKENARPCGDNEKAGKIDGRSDRDPNKRGDECQDDSGGNGKQGVPHECDADNDEIENQQAEPDRGRSFVFRDANPNQDERQKRQIIWPRRFLGGRFRRSGPNREAGMKNRKDNVAAQGPPKQRGDQIVSSPAPEKNKNDSASEWNEKVAFGVKQSEAEQADLREKDVTEKKRRTETQ